MKEHIITVYTVHLDEAHTYSTQDTEQAEELSREGHKVTAKTMTHP